MEYNGVDLCYQFLQPQERYPVEKNDTNSRNRLINLYPRKTGFARKVFSWKLPSYSQQTPNKYNSKGITKFSSIQFRKAENQQSRGGRRETYKYNHSSIIYFSILFKLIRTLESTIRLLSLLYIVFPLFIKQIHRFNQNHTVAALYTASQPANK